MTKTGTMLRPTELAAGFEPVGHSDHGGRPDAPSPPTTMVGWTSRSSPACREMPASVWPSVPPIEAPICEIGKMPRS